MGDQLNKVVLAYSGGLDTSVMLHWLKAKYDCEVICVTADVGQAEELDGLEEKALKSGASSFHIARLADEFAEDFVYPAIQANAHYENYYLLGTSLARPPIFKAMVDIANQEGADAIAHGATGKGNDQVRFELTAYALNPDIKIVAPWREWEFKGREDLLAYCAEHNIHTTSSAEKPYSMDRNLMHISYEGGILEDPWAAPPKEMFLTTTDPMDAPDTPTELEIGFESGNATTLDGKRLTAREMIESLNQIGGAHGVGRVDIVENRYVGIKSRGVYETPGVTILHAAHHAIESLTLDRETLRLRDSLVPKFSELVYNGYWYSPEMEHLLRFMADIQQGVTGTARIRLYKGSCIATGRKAPNSLYSPAYATFEEDTVYNQKDAEGFIKINALRLKLHNLRKRKALMGEDADVDIASLRSGYIE